MGPRAISRTVRVTHGEVCRIIRPYQTNGTYSPFSQGGRRNPSRLSDNVLESIELFKLMKNSMFGREIRERLLNDGVCDGGNLPALSTVNKRIKNKLHACHSSKYSIKRRLHPSIFFISSNIELSIFNLKLFSWNSTFKRNLSSSKVARLLEDTDHVFSLLVTQDGTDQRLFFTLSRKYSTLQIFQ